MTVSISQHFAGPVSYTHLPFDIAELREIMSYDEMELDKIGDRKTALFLIMSDTDLSLIHI